MSFIEEIKKYFGAKEREAKLSCSCGETENIKIKYQGAKDVAAIKKCGSCAGTMTENE